MRDESQLGVQERRHLVLDRRADVRRRHEQGRGDQLRHQHGLQQLRQLRLVHGGGRLQRQSVGVQERRHLVRDGRPGLRRRHQQRDGRPVVRVQSGLRRDGVLRSCTDGQSCSGNPGVCYNGVASCSTGSSMCVNGSAKAAGTSCGANMVCNGSGRLRVVHRRHVVHG
jgi:hypothetical protein